MSEADKTGRDEEEIRKLLEEAGPRPSIPEDDLAGITEAAREVWLRRYGDRRTAARPGRWWLGLAAAAVLAVALDLAWWERTLDPHPLLPQPASIELLSGTVRMWSPSGDGPVSLPPGALGRHLPAGSQLETGGEGSGGRLALRMAGGASVRLDAGTRIRLSTAQSFNLERGALYIDSGTGPGGMAVLTAAGLFHEIGTQFEVRIEGKGAEATTRLRVREGRVALKRGDEPVVTKAGEELILRADGHIARRQAPVFGPEWDWVVQVAPRLDIEGLKVRAFLDWLGRETGWRIEFADQEAASLADSVVLHGSIEHLTLTEAPGVVLASCGLGHRVSEGTMVVFVAEEPR
jgi:ferric-dicitrate binding protein FerR (iron transport regulator)